MCKDKNGFESRHWTVTLTRHFIARVHFSHLRMSINNYLSGWIWLLKFIHLRKQLYNKLSRFHTHANTVTPLLLRLFSSGQTYRSDPCSGRHHNPIYSPRHFLMRENRWSGWWRARPRPQRSVRVRLCHTDSTLVLKCSEKWTASPLMSREGDLDPH